MKHKTGTRKQWLSARLKLLEAEKDLTRRSDELARRRQKLPWVRIENDYRFETEEGNASLADLSEGDHSYLFITSCLDRTMLQDVQPARQYPTVLMAWEYIYPTTMSHFQLYRVPLLQSCRRTSAEWDGHSPGHHH